MKRFKDESGLALIITLLVVVLLTVLILEFDFSTRTDLLAATNFRDGTKAFYLAQSGVAAAKAVLRDDAQHSPGYDAFDELWATPFPPYPVGDGAVTVSIQDEEGKLNPNDLVNPQGAAIEKRVMQMKRLFELLNQDPNLVDAIVDWIDHDLLGGNEPYSIYGAEEDYYSRLNPPYHCKNLPLSVLTELHMIRGITDEVYEKISPYLMVTPGQPGEGRININTAEAVVLQTLPLSASIKFPITEATAKDIMDARPFKTLADFKNVPGTSSSEEGGIDPSYYKITSRYFAVISSGTVNGFVKTVRAGVDRQSSSQINTVFWKIE
jgi:general secretion pathway protein K